MIPAKRNKKENAPGGQKSFLSVVGASRRSLDQLETALGEI
jgi:hypothetical protein